MLLCVLWVQAICSRNVSPTARAPPAAADLRRPRPDLILDSLALLVTDGNRPPPPHRGVAHAASAFADPRRLRAQSICGALLARSFKALADDVARPRRVRLARRRRAGTSCRSLGALGTPAVRSGDFAVAVVPLIAAEHRN